MTLFDGHAGEAVPSGCRRVPLDGRLSSDLNWEQSRQAALGVVAQGMKVFWELDLGLFQGLSQPLTSQTQFASLNGALDHFRTTLWPEFASATAGLCLYRGCAAPFLAQRDQLVGYLDLLAVNMPDALPLYLLLDANSLEPWETIVLFDRECFARWHCLIKADRLPFSLYQSKSPVALCLPTEEKCAFLLKEGINALLGQGIAFRIIPESLLITEWDQLDYLVVHPGGLSSQGLRKLQGFCAAGGCVVTLGETIGIQIEMGFEAFLHKHVQWGEK